MDRLAETLAQATARIEAGLREHGAVEGRLSSSALSTATAAFALALAAEHDGRHREPAERGHRWLCDNQNEDGGWGDTVDSPSNISTTALCWASLARARGSAVEAAVAGAERWLARECGSSDAEALTRTLRSRYGADQTFSVPILTMCALAGRLGGGGGGGAGAGAGGGGGGWQLVPQLPFELAACPAAWFRVLRLRVVSYALPALIAIGQVRHHFRPTWNPLARLARALTRRRTLRLLRAIQPSTGGYLEAAPLTSFVAMSMIAMGRAGDAVAVDALRFLTDTVRADGSWAIDVDLRAWLTSLAVDATGTCPVAAARWLLRHQRNEVHPYTQADPGGWAWTDRDGGVPDADDTAAAVLALRYRADPTTATRVADGRAVGAAEPPGEASPVADGEVRRAARRGIEWLLGVQNGDGGMPTFCRGWGRLPFDRSGTDLAAHALRAFAAWRDDIDGESEDRRGSVDVALDAGLRRRIDRASRATIAYLLRMQRADGAWIPLWFGNQHDAAQENPIYGTSRVLRAVASVRSASVSVDGSVDESASVAVDGSPSLAIDESASVVADDAAWVAAGRRAVAFLLARQGADGGFGAVPSVEETALAVGALAEWNLAARDAGAARSCREAVRLGCAWLVEATGGGERFPAAPIGLYFARLWYSEELYPVLFTVAALRAGRACLAARRPDEAACEAP